MQMIMGHCVACRLTTQTQMLTPLIVVEPTQQLATLGTTYEFGTIVLPLDLKLPKC